MATYPIKFVDQLRQHLRALRKKQGLTQAQLGAKLGVSQSRIAEIEANPGAVTLEKLLQLLSALGAGMALTETIDEPSDRTHEKEAEQRPLGAVQQQEVQTCNATNRADSLQQLSNFASLLKNYLECPESPTHYTSHYILAYDKLHKKSPAPDLYQSCFTHQEQAAIKEFADALKASERDKQHPASREVIKFLKNLTEQTETKQPRLFFSYNNKKGSW